VPSRGTPDEISRWSGDARTPADRSRLVAYIASNLTSCRAAASEPGLQGAEPPEWPTAAVRAARGSAPVGVLDRRRSSRGGVADRQLLADRGFGDDEQRH